MFENAVLEFIIIFIDDDEGLTPEWVNDESSMGRDGRRAYQSASFRTILSFSQFDFGLAAGVRR